jgi:hypothetical protein
MKHREFHPVPFMSMEEMDRQKRRLRRTFAVIYAVFLPVIFVVLWFALR